MSDGDISFRRMDAQLSVDMKSLRSSRDASCVVCAELLSELGPATPPLSLSLCCVDWTIKFSLLLSTTVVCVSVEGQRLRLSSDAVCNTPTVLNARTALVCTYGIESTESALHLPFTVFEGDDDDDEDDDEEKEEDEAEEE